jgi:hypothetical protein
MWFLVIMISPTILLADANRVGVYGPYPSQTACEQAGKLFADTGMTPVWFLRWQRESNSEYMHPVL